MLEAKVVKKNGKSRVQDSVETISGRAPKPAKIGAKPTGMGKTSQAPNNLSTEPYFSQMKNSPFLSSNRIGISIMASRTKCCGLAEHVSPTYCGSEKMCKWQSCRRKAGIAESNPGSGRL
ncbi:MAG: hypothetical protein NZ602_04345 [Thermoguttaceae bacterium]|nr:hypothetical protein [Thermoguttaceae bacterium]MDW8036665.1 hypothetical protein [Thermoguttaceae bacterium]